MIRQSPSPSLHTFCFFPGWPTWRVMTGGKTWRTGWKKIIRKLEVLGEDVEAPPHGQSYYWMIAYDNDMIGCRDPISCAILSMYMEIENLMWSRDFQCENLLVTLNCLTNPVIVTILMVIWKISMSINFGGTFFIAGKRSLWVFSMYTNVWKVIEQLLCTMDSSR